MTVDATVDATDALAALAARQLARRRARNAVRRCTVAPSVHLGEKKSARRGADSAPTRHSETRRSRRATASTRAGDVATRASDKN
jgi:hypothetical protein